VIGALALGLIAALWCSDAVAAPDGGTITGTIKLAPPNERGEVKRRGRGFTDRVTNPLKPPKMFNPLPHIVVVLEGGKAPPDDTAPGAAVKYRLIGEAFEIPLLPVLAGSSVDVHNDSPLERVFYSPDDDKAFDTAPVKTKQKRSLKKFGPAGRVIEVRAQDSAHISGTVVAFPHPYFSGVDDSGKFEIRGVPPGPWKIKIWYRTGWVKMPEVTVDVVGKKSVATTVELPAKLTSAPEPAEPTPGDETEGD